MKQQKILFVASECTPFFSTGGLGDVIGSLPQAIKKRRPKSVDIRVILPLYEQLPSSIRRELTPVLETKIPLSWREQYCGILQTQREGVTYYFVDNEYYFKRKGLYGHYDDGERFAFFCKAVCSLLDQLDFVPHVLHAHDWQSALAVIYLKCKEEFAKYRSVKTVFTIHNIAFQGIYDFSILGDVLELPWEASKTVDYGGLINLMKGAIVCCDKLTTVSPTYAKEIRTKDYAFGLESILKENAYKTVGILNGIDYSVYDPQSSKLASTFSPASLGGKKACKRYLQQQAGLPEEKAALFGVISRLTEQKGIDLILSTAHTLLNRGAQLVVLGTGEKHFEDGLCALQERYPQQVRVFLKFDKELAGDIYAGSDFFLMPSRTEPCGLAQMMAMRYGTLPIVRETGGLADSVRDVGWETGGWGITFKNFTADDLCWSLDRALALYGDELKHQQAVKLAMTTDVSWRGSAGRYLAEYESIN